MLFEPPFAIGHAHIQTLLGSSGRKLVVRKRAISHQAVEKPNTINTSCGARLVAFESCEDASRPMVILIHGWLGNHISGYLLSLAESLWQAGFNVTRLNLRDHGNTAHLNEGMFHNGLIEEVTEAVEQLQQKYGDVALAGFSLGGNFALRISKALGIYCFAISPLIDPASSVMAIDKGWFGYRVYFMRKWFKAMREKEQAFPARYNFKSTGAFKLRTVHSMTEHFVEHFSPYDSLAEYYDLYTLTGETLKGVNASILAAADDPIVPGSDFVDLPVETRLTAQGGHCAFIDAYGMSSFADKLALELLSKHFDL